MADIIEMPKLSDTMTIGVIASWNKKAGDRVKSGELLAEVETDKATMELESWFDGVLLYTAVEAGGGVPVGDLIAIVGKEGEEVEPILKAYQVKKGATASPAPEPATVSVPEPVVAVVPASISEAKPTSNVVSTSDARIKASPLAKALAKEKGIDLHAIQGSGDAGRIVKRDVDSFQPTAAPSSSSFSSSLGKESFEEVPVSQMRKTIARRLGESKFTAPHFYLTMEIDMERAVDSRTRLNESAEVKISFNDLVIKAVAAALRKHPKVNSSWLGDKIRYNHHIHIGMAVAVEEGLLVPVIRHADLKSLSDIATEAKSLAQKAKNKQLQPADWEGNTFTISNLGMFGIDQFTAIINPPDACILAIGGIQQQPVVRNGQIVPGHIMKVTLSCDHRVVDGALGAAFLVTLKSFLEDPIRILL
ncbi:MAG: pyruvate dehydrogenase complex dihydrolipoamide acetyltransferase [Sphingobacteriia bacterium]|nr:pyruvate dehydrogenase complex dihydrolipoamide acetyltransferase [Sphingobacteriia bacterium]